MHCFYLHMDSFYSWYLKKTRSYSRFWSKSIRFFNDIFKEKENLYIIKKTLVDFEIHDSADQWIARKILMITPKYKWFECIWCVILQRSRRLVTRAVLCGHQEWVASTCIRMPRCREIHTRRVRLSQNCWYC